MYKTKKVSDKIVENRSKKLKNDVKIWYFNLINVKNFPEIVQNKKSYKKSVQTIRTYVFALD